MKNSTTSTQNASSSKNASSMADLMSRMGGSIKPLQKGDIVEGIIKKLTPKEILLDIGAKGDALVIEYDKQNLENLLSLLKVGDKVKASVISVESEEGFPVVSLRRMLDDMVFSKFDDINKNSSLIEVSVLESTRGGYFVETDQGVKGFLPNSQVAVDEDITGTKIEAKIIEFDRAKKRVIFSQKAAVYVSDPKVITKYIKPLDKVDAKIISVTPYGIYATILPSPDVVIEGFIHISEVSYDRVENLMSLFKKNDTVKAQVIDIDSENRRVNLSIKRLSEDLFTGVKEKYKKDQKVTGKVTDVKSRGVSVEIEKGINGLIPTNKIPSGKEYKAGEEVTCEVSDYDDKRRIILLTPVLTAVPIGYR